MRLSGMVALGWSLCWALISGHWEDSVHLLARHPVCVGGSIDRLAGPVGLREA